MKESVSKLKMFFYATSFLTLTCVILRTISFFTAYDSEIGYFSNEKFLPYLHKSLLVATTLFLLFVFVIIKVNTLPKTLPALNTLTTFSSMLCGLMYLCSSILLFVKIKSGRSHLISIILITAILASLYYIVEAFSKKSTSLAFKICTGLFTIVNLITIVLFENIDFSVQVNGPNKVIIIISFAIISLFIIQELRYNIEKVQPRAYVFTALGTMLICFTASIPGIIAHYSHILNDSKYLLYYLIDFTFAIYAFTKIQAYTKYASNLSHIECPDENIASESSPIQSNQSTEK